MTRVVAVLEVLLVILLVILLLTLRGSGVAAKRGRCALVKGKAYALRPFP